MRECSTSSPGILVRVLREVLPARILILPAGILEVQLGIPIKDSPGISLRVRTGVSPGSPPYVTMVVSLAAPLSIFQKLLQEFS